MLRIAPRSRYSMWMASRDYRRNHYVPRWYQRRFFLPEQKEEKSHYLDLLPGTFTDITGSTRTKTALRRWGTPRCFCQDDLYTTRFGAWESTEIEEKFFGEIDRNGRRALEYFSNFEHPSIDTDAFHNLLIYMSTQKLRTPKGLAWLAAQSSTLDKNTLLFVMQDIKQMHCAIWTECVWQIADASRSSTKFIISDHPVTVYNRACFPMSRWCRGTNDPDIRLHGTHTLFPLSIEKVLILTNLSWVRNPYQRPRKLRPNPNLFRPAMFNFMDIQTHRHLSETEVHEVNLIIKKRALRYIAAARKDWLYPEKYMPTQHWSKLGGGYLLMPDPRSVTFSREIIIGYKEKQSDSFDEYGRKPWQEGYKDEELADREWKTFLRFQGEFARLYGPGRRGRAFQMMCLDPERDDDDYHRYHIGLEEKFRPRRPAGRRSRAC